MSKQLTKAAFKKEIINFFEQKMSIEEAKIQIRKKLQNDEFDNSIRVSNVRVFYTSNKNFSGGVKNGYGAGWYISNSTTEIKI